MKVMVVDDEEDIQLLFKQKFRKEIKAGYIDFYFARSAEIAFDYLQEEGKASVVLILSDINMPGMNGLELLKLIKENFPILKVFMVTAHDEEQNYQAAILYGADGYINKPINFQSLKEKIFTK